MTLSPARADSHDRRAPGEAELWVFLLGDLVLFAFFFGVWCIGALQAPDLFAAGRQAANGTIGLVNTVALLTSSWWVATAVLLARQDRPTLAHRWLVGAIGLGALFVVLKIIEYDAKIRHGVDLQANTFDMEYFVFTGIHLLHVFVGIAALSLAASRCRRASLTTADNRFIEGVASYWHVVDVLWIVLFLLIYIL